MATDQAPPVVRVLARAPIRTARKSDVFSRAVIATPIPLRTVLFVPGDDRRKIDKALGLGASAVMLDLEDGVAVDAKAGARATVAEALLAAPPGSPPMGVRVNSLPTGLADSDLEALAGSLARIALITLPMVESADDVRHVAGRLDALERAAGVAAGSVALLAMTETARGILAAPAIAASSPRLRTLLFGPGDLGRELAVEHTADGFEHLHARSAMVLAARAAGKEGPIDGPYLKLDDDEGCAVSAAWARRLGFQGKVACTRASCRSPRPRSHPGSASWPGRAPSIAPSARPRPRASPRSSSPTARSWTLPWPSARAPSCARTRADTCPARRATRLRLGHTERAMKVERIRKAYEQVADQLLSKINSGELKPGDRLPSEAELAADFGVSRTTVREALRILATRNLIQTRKGMAGGHFIVEPTVGSISEFLVANYGLLTAANRSRSSISCRRRDDRGAAAAIAARNRDDDDLERIRTTFSDDIEAVSPTHALAKFRNFHLYLLEATKNHLLVAAAVPIFTVLQSTVVRRRPTRRRSPSSSATTARSTAPSRPEDEAARTA